MSFDSDSNISGSDDVEGGFSPQATINVTPLVDVMLVLLVIFMVTAPMLQQGVEVNLPKATTAPLPGKEEQLVLSIKKDGTVYIGSDNPVEVATLAAKVRAVLEAKNDPNGKVYIKADTELSYGEVMQIMGVLHQGGITNIGLVSSPEGGAPESKDSVASKKKRS